MHEFVKGDRVTYCKHKNKTGNTAFNGCIGTVIQGNKLDSRVVWDTNPKEYPSHPYGLVHYNHNLSKLQLDIPGDNDDDCI